jgi:hypothetical protein
MGSFCSVVPDVTAGSNFSQVDPWFLCGLTDWRGLGELLFEDQETKCPGCKAPLTWLSHVKRWEQAREIHEFSFRCEACNREYEFKDNQLVERKQGRDPIAESTAIHQARLRDAQVRRCLNCGGPIVNWEGLSALRCEWCHQEYSWNCGELQPSSMPFPCYCYSPT